MEENSDAREALALAADSRRRLADRLVTPVWYYPAMGITLGMIAYAIGMPEGTVERRIRISVLVGTALINALVLPWCYRQQTGVWIQRATGPRSRRLFLLCLIPFAVLFAAVGVNYLLDGPTWAALALGAIAFVGTLIFGRSYDRALRADLREGGAR